MHFYYCAVGVDIHIAGAGGNGQNSAGGSGMKKTVPRRALVCTSSAQLCRVLICAQVCDDWQEMAQVQLRW